MAAKRVPTMLFGPSLREWAYNMSGFNKYGLMRDDVINETPDVVEALRRLPKHLVDERNFRLIRAAQLDFCKVILPKEEWTKYSEDVRYLAPYIEEVQKERKEREKWEKE
ncbi:cytochrome b-c1 complex subunit 7 [Cephus cinctus]|uniref:Cytochrome b-c1 complex subunit 7 n=1 Tax=Cephus cinctus TaxID=211228 RepID=A0AAJ7FEG9_CEPCN|nr:cytochrome b-c1 complex subunit 7 [Cephus cinctus]